MKARSRAYQAIFAVLSKTEPKKIAAISEEASMEYRAAAKQLHVMCCEGVAFRPAYGEYLLTNNKEGMV